jgi:uncharacterized protein (DUF983 family)
MSPSWDHEHVSNRDRDLALYVGLSIMVIGQLVVVVFALLDSQKTVLTWVQVVLGIYIVGYATYVLVRKRRRSDARDDTANE